MRISTLDYTFWVAGFVGHLLLLAVLVYKWRTTRFPCFSLLILFSVLRSLALYSLRTSPLAYFYVYWSLSFIDTVLQIAVFAEISWKLFRPTGRWSRDILRPLFCLAAVSICLALLIAYLSDPPARLMDQRFVLRGELFSTMLMAEVFAGLTLLSATSGFVWKSQTAAIARGLGIYSVFSLLIQGAQALVGVQGGSSTFHVLAQCQIACYLLCLGWWIVALLRDAPATSPLPESLKSQLSQFDAYMSSTLGRLRSIGYTS